MCENRCCYASKFVQDLMTIDTLQKLELLVCQSWRGFRFLDGRKRYTVHPVLKIGIFSIVQGEYSELSDSIYY
jgi:hypothetical protein